MASTSDFRNGLCIEWNQDVYTIVEFQHVKPGKGGAFVRTKLKSLTTGKTVDNTFNAGTRVTTVRIERLAHQFLYEDSVGYHFMDNSSFEQVVLSKDLVSGAAFLKEGQEVQLLFRDATVLDCELPPFVELRVTYTEPGCRGNTVTNAVKPAELETGLQVQVPLFIDQNDLLKIDTRTGLYVERVK